MTYNSQLNNHEFSEIGCATPELRQVEPVAYNHPFSFRGGGCAVSKSSEASANRLYFGDNFDVLREKIKDATVDLAYLDPPFNSKAAYNLLYETPQNFTETAQRTVFHDTWSWEDEAERYYQHTQAHGGRVAALMEGLKQSIGRNGTTAYLATMAARLIELRRVLKPTGSLYLHCDPTASHYLKIILDSIFGPQSFCNEIVWQRSDSHNSAKRYGRIHDSILFFSASKTFTWNKQYTPYSEAQLGRYKQDENGDWFKAENLTADRRDSESGKFSWRGTKPGPSRGWAYTEQQLEAWWREGRILKKRDGTPRLDGLKVLRKDMPGQPLQDIWTDIPRVANVSTERLGFPTQKPATLLKRIIAASSNEGDVVLDAFCGCGTTIEAAQELKRKWIGIDVSYYAVRLVERRVKSKFKDVGQIITDGIPADYSSAEALAEKDRYGFQQWAVSELGCQLWNDGKKGADGGIDGEMRFYGGPDKIGHLLVQVKGGKRSTPAQVREFCNVIDDAKAEMGVFFCRSEPTDDMKTIAARAGRYRIGKTSFPRLQFCTLASWYAGQRPEMPVPLQFEVQGDGSRPSRKQHRPDPKQPGFAFVLKGGDVPKGRILNPQYVSDDLLRNA